MYFLNENGQKNKTTGSFGIENTNYYFQPFHSDAKNKKTKQIIFFMTSERKKPNSKNIT